MNTNSSEIPADLPSKARLEVSRRTALGLGGAVVAGALLAGSGGATRANALEPWPFTMGVNLSGLDAGGTIPGTANVDYAIPTTAELDYFALRGLTHIRLPFKWERLQPTMNGALDATYLGYITALADYAGDHGIQLLLDNHNFGTYASHPLGSSQTPSSALADLWTRLATVFVGHPGIYGYDLMNEPHDMPSPTAWPDAAQAAVNAIRLVDTATAIYVEGDGWSSASAWPTTNADLDIADPSDNLVYSAHMYFDRDSSGTHFDWATEVAAGDVLHNPVAPLTVDTGANRIAAFVGWLQQKGFRGHIGETGTANNDPNWLTALDHMLAYCQAQGVPVTYWAGGLFFRSYPLGVEPTDDRDTVQMAVLTKYSGGAKPSNYFVSGSNRGAAATASTAFAIDYRGLITSAFTITPHDGGGGGSFSPASVTLQPGFNGTAAFTYTAAGTGTYAITTLNSAGLTPPAALGFSTRADAYSGIADAAVLNVLSAGRFYSPFVGSGVTLRRDSDGAQQAFAYASDDTLDSAAIASWAGTSAVSVVTLADQSPAVHDAGPVTTSNQEGVGGALLPSSPADYPKLVLGGLAGQPVLRFNRSRMDAVSPLAGATGFTCFLVAKPSSLVGMQRLLSWVVTDYVTIGNGTGGWEMSAEGTLAQPLGTDPTAWHIYAVRWQAAGQRTSWVDGGQVASTAATGASIPMAYDNRVNIGYFRWYHDVYFDGDVYGLFPFAAALDDTQMAAMWSALSDQTGIAVTA